ncbi:uncharacterized protein LOC100378459 [Saccoglossus kowalevskii]
MCKAVTYCVLLVFVALLYVNLCQGEICRDVCIQYLGNDGSCDDGGDGADTDNCTLGHDCTDCGDRNGVCEDDCSYVDSAHSFDGYCDDGGPTSHTNMCPYGNDCYDCGLREAVDICEDECVSDNNYDGSCDDGGSGSDTSLCQLGTDCGDCGPRDNDLCLNTCFVDATNNGDCEDGEEGAVDNICNKGYDCTDCEPRDYTTIEGVTEGEGTVCSDYCVYDFTSDTFCDDGGEGAEEVQYCALGHDCDDCGDRNGVCENDCLLSVTNNGICEDGGPNDEAGIDLCRFGYDCGDCGEQQLSAGLLQCYVCDDPEYENVMVSNDNANCFKPKLCNPGEDYCYSDIQVTGADFLIEKGCSSAPDCSDVEYEDSEDSCQTSRHICYDLNLCNENTAHMATFQGVVLLASIFFSVYTY